MTISESAMPIVSLRPVRGTTLRLVNIKTNGGTQPRAEVDPDVVQEYSEAMQSGREFPPLIVFHDGENHWLADGFHRYYAAVLIGQLECQADVRQGTRRDAVLYSVGANATHGLRRTNADKRRAVQTLLEDPEWGQWSDREIARRCSVHHDMVGQIRRQANGILADSASDESATMQIFPEPVRFINSNGSESSMRTENLSQPRVSFMDYQQPPTQSQENRLAVHFSSDSPEWYTPRHVIDAVVATLGAVDLDPCSNSASNPNVPAKHHLTQADDGLSQPWFGRVYMNPPYGREIVAWIEKLAHEYLDGHVSEAVALVPARTDTAWFRMLPDGLACFFSGRLAFSGSEMSAPFPSVAWYIGPNSAAFIAAFAGHGDIYQRIERTA